MLNDNDLERDIRPATHLTDSDAPPPAAAPREQFAPDADRFQFTCTLCGCPMYGVHCKMNCPNCGYREDCSDLFRA